MSVKETIHQWVEDLADDSKTLQELYEQARIECAIGEAMEDVQTGRFVTFEEMDRRMEQKWAKRLSQ